MKDFAWFLEVPDHATAGQDTRSGAVRAASRHAAQRLRSNVFLKSLFLGPCLSALDFRHRVAHTHGGHGGVKPILHCGPRGLAGVRGWLQKHAKQPNS